MTSCDRQTDRRTIVKVLELRAYDEHFGRFPHELSNSWHDGRLELPLTSCNVLLGQVYSDRPTSQRQLSSHSTAPTPTQTPTDTDSTDTSIHPYVRYAPFLREDPREDVRVRVRVGVVECQLYNSLATTQRQ